jgi:hypothetical protein
MERGVAPGERPELRALPHGRGSARGLGLVPVEGVTGGIDRGVTPAQRAGVQQRSFTVASRLAVLGWQQQVS